MVFCNEGITSVNVLLVEDDPGSRNLVRRALCDNNHNVSYNISEAKSLADANHILSRESFDNVLLDLGLPDSSGIDTLESIRRTAPNIPVVVLSCSNDYETAIDSIRHGADYYLVKSGTLNEILGRSICYSIQRQRMQTINKSNDELQQQIELLKSEVAQVNKSLAEQTTYRHIAEDTILKINEDQDILLDTIPAMMWHVDIAGNIIRTNSQSTKLIGKQTHEVTGENFYNLFIANPDILKKRVKEVIEKQSATNCIPTFFKTDNNSLRKFNLDITPYCKSYDKINGIVFFAKESAERKINHLGAPKNNIVNGLITAKPTLTFEKNRVLRKPSEEVQAGFGNSYNGKVLIVDDDSLNLILISTILSKMNVEVSFARKGNEALELAKRNSFDLILSSLQIPEIDGFGFMARLRENGIFTPAIAITTDFREETILECSKAGFDGHIFKPIERKDIIELLNKYLNTAHVN